MAAVTIRDIPINIELNDSCNCCWWCCPPNPPVYITHDLAAEEFDKTKSKDHEADRMKSYKRIEGIVKKLQETSEACKDIDLTKRREFLTLNDIFVINQGVYLYFEKYGPNSQGRR